MANFRRILLFIITLILSIAYPIAAVASEKVARQLPIVNKLEDDILLTPQVLGWLLFASVLVLFAILLWNRLLRRQLDESTGQLQQQQQQIQSQSIIDAIAESGEGLIIVDPDYRINNMNSVMINWFGDQVGKLCYSSLKGRKEPCPKCQMAAAINLGETAIYYATEKDGRTFEVVETPIHNHDGRTSILGIIRDVS